MRKITSFLLAMIMICMVFAVVEQPDACADNEPEKNLVIFRQIENRDGVTIATVRQLHLESRVENGRIKLILVDTKHEDSFVIADNAVLQTIDLSSGNLVDAKAATVTLDVFKTSALKLSDGDKLVYTIEVKDNTIVSASSELLFFAEKELTATTTPAPKYIQCNKCGKWYAEGKEFNSHVCVPPTAKLIQCPDCFNWYEEGNKYLNHICECYVVYAQCPECLEWFEEGYEYNTHTCGYHITETEEYIKCPDCYQWFTVAGYYSHYCPADYYEEEYEDIWVYEDVYEDVWIYEDVYEDNWGYEEEYYMCENCGGWFDIYQYLAHACY